MHLDERGSQALELVMLTPLVIMLMLVLVAAGRLGVALVHAQQTAGLAARIAAVEDDVAVVDALAEHGLVIESIVPPSSIRAAGGLVTVTVSRQVRLGPPLPQIVRLTASATAMVEHRTASEDGPR